MITYKDAKEMLQGRESKKIRYATYLHNRGEYFAIRHHETDIIKIFPRKTVLDCNGWKSRTTKDRLNYYSPASIWSDKGIWFASFNGKTVLYKDGLTVHCNGCFTGGDSLSKAKDEKRLRKQVKTYSKAFVAELRNGRIDKPSEMDCFDCGMLDKGIEPNCNDTHLLSHIEESYFVPSLVRNAVIAFPVSEMAKATLYYTWNDAPSINPLYGDCFADIAWEQIEKSIKKFLYQKLGLVR